MNYSVFSQDDGRLVRYGSVVDPSHVHFTDDTLVFFHDFDPARVFLNVDGQVEEIPPSPGNGFVWDWYAKSWLPDVAAARGFKKQEAESELERRIYLPCNGFDAGKTSRERISGTITRIQRGDGLPPLWIGWRDANNVMHWALDDAETVLAHLTALSRAIEDREQAILVASWRHKANIEAMTTVEEILSYDATQGWPDDQPS